MLRKEKGITLVALVITVIVLLILAGVSIAALTGNNNIISGANKAKENYAAEATRENEILSNFTSEYSEYFGN